MHTTKRITLLVSVASAVATASGCASSGHPIKWTRAEFATAMFKIKEGMTSDSVRRRLGPPDDVRTEADLEPGMWTQNSLTWCYGTSGHNTFPTLGCVTFDDKGRVCGTTGGHGSDVEPYEDDDDGTNHPNPADPPSPAVIPEHELRRLLVVIDGLVRQLDRSMTFDPRIMIRTVNALQAQGKEKALAAIQEYQRIEPADSSNTALALEFLIKTLFDLPNGVIPDPPGLFTTADDVRDEPRFPMTNLDDIPFLIGHEGGYSGPPPTAFRLIRFYEKHGRIRSKQLVPPNRPIDTLTHVFGLERMQLHAPGEPDVENRFNVVLLEQLLWLVDSVYRDASPDPMGDKLIDGCDPTAAARIMQNLAKLEIFWDSDQQKYTFYDGSSLPEVPQIDRPRQYWRPASLTNFNGRLCVKRVSAILIWTLLEWKQPEVGESVPLTIRCLESNAKMFDFHIPDPRPLTIGGSNYDDLCRHITSYDHRVCAIGEVNDDPDAYIELADGMSIQFVVLNADGTEADRWTVTP